MRFAYAQLPTHGLGHPMSGATVRYRPIIPIGFVQPGLSVSVRGCIDSAADDTVFSEHTAQRLQLDLTEAPQGAAKGIGGSLIHVRFARVTLYLADALECFTWEAIVGFAPLQMPWALLGHTGFLEFFDVDLLGQRREAFIRPNGAFTGQHLVYQPAPP